MRQVCYVAEEEGGCGPKAVAVTLVDIISSCGVSGILRALDAGEVLNQQAVHQLLQELDAILGCSERTTGQDLPKLQRALYVYPPYCTILPTSPALTLFV